MGPGTLCPAAAHSSPTAVTEALMAPGRVPGCSGTRNLQDNLSDLRAQVAANQKGIQLVTELIRFHGLPVVQAYMAHIQVGPAGPPGPPGPPGPAVTPAVPRPTPRWPCGRC